MSKRYEFYGTHYSKNSPVMASEVDVAYDDGTVVMYVNQQKIYEGAVEDIYFGINDWLKSDATEYNKYALVDWCNSWGDPFFEEDEKLPDDAELAKTVAWLINEEYRDTIDTPEGFYIDGAEYINMEVFLKSDEIKD